MLTNQYETFFIEFLHIFVLILVHILSSIKFRLVNWLIGFTAWQLLLGYLMPNQFLEAITWF